MPLFTPPTVEEVKAEANLTVAQVNQLWTTATYEADIATLIAEQVAVVEGRIRRRAAPLAWPFSDAAVAARYTEYTEAERTTLIEQQKSTAELAAKYSAVSAIYLKAGQLNDKYLAKATEYRNRAEWLLTGYPNDDEDDGLLGDIGDIKENQGAATSDSGVAIMTIQTADAFASGDEYAA